MSANQEESRLLLRLPGALKARLKAQAERNRRSLNSEIVVMLSQSLCEQGSIFENGEKK